MCCVTAVDCSLVAVHFQYLHAVADHGAHRRGPLKGHAQNKRLSCCISPSRACRRLDVTVKVPNYCGNHVHRSGDRLPEYADGARMDRVRSRAASEATRERVQRRMRQMTAQSWLVVDMAQEPSGSVSFRDAPMRGRPAWPKLTCYCHFLESS